MWKMHIAVVSLGLLAAAGAWLPLRAEPRAPSLDALLGGYPTRGRLSCQVHERTAPLPLDVEAQIAAMRKVLSPPSGAVETDEDIARREQNLANTRTQLEKIRAGVDRTLERVYYWAPGRWRQTERGTRVGTGEAYVSHRYRAGSEEYVLYDDPKTATDVHGSRHPHSDPALQEVLLEGVSLRELVDVKRARVTLEDGNWVLRAPPAASYHDTFGAGPPIDPIEIRYGVKPPWIPLSVTQRREDNTSSVASLSEFSDFHGVVFPRLIEFEATGRPGQPPANQTTVRIGDLVTGASVPDMEFVPIVKHDTIVVDGRLRKGLNYGLRAGERIPTRGELPRVEAAQRRMDLKK